MLFRAVPFALALVLGASLLLQAAPPNVLFILGDDQGWGDYGFMGHAQIRTPHLDRLAKESLVYTRGYVPHSLCRPSLASIITGLYPHQHRIVGNNPPLPPGVAAAPVPKLWTDERFQANWNALIANLDRGPRLPAVLAAGGYLTAQTGKWWEGNFRRGGFTHGMTHGDPLRGGRHGDAGLAIGRPSVQQAIDYMEVARQGGKPFFLWYAPILPHVPHNAPQKYLDMYARVQPLNYQKYFANCTWFDDGVGTLLDYLDKHDLAKETLVVFLADNGWVQPITGEGGATGAPRGKRSPYDGGLRTPILLRWPGKIAPRMERERLASSVDLLPTIVAACGLPLPDAASGLKLPGVNLADEQAVAARTAVCGATFDHDIRSLENPAASLQYRWIVSGRWKLVAPSDRVPNAQPELFEIVDDPREERNRAAEQPPLVAQLRAELDAWWRPEK